MRVARAGLAAVLLLAAAAGSAAGQVPSRAEMPILGAALVAEREGRLEDAAGHYQRALDVAPGSAAAILGMERVFGRLGWTDSLAPYLERALEAEPRSELLHGVALRQAAATGQQDIVLRAARAWIAARPESAAPYQQWAFWLMQQRLENTALRVLREGQERLGVAVLAPDMARLLTARGEWADAAAQWRIALARNGALLTGAATVLGQAPEAHRDLVLEQLLRDDPPPSSSWLAVDLLARWGRPLEAWPVLDRTLPDDRVAAVTLLWHFAEQAARLRTPQGDRARGLALERVAERSEGESADRARLAAARSFAAAGDLQGAERMLSRLATSAEEPGPEAAAVMAAYIAVLAEAGRVDEAEERFEQWEPYLGGGDAAELRERLAWVHVQRGQLDRAEVALGEAATVSAEAVAGWVALYRGDLARARTHFRAAGPGASSRTEATERAATLVLLERIEAERLPALGEGLLQARRGDTAAALSALERAAEQLRPQGGRADVLVLAGDMAVAIQTYGRAEELFGAAIDADSAGAAAPGAEYRLALVYAETGREQAAAVQLERLILAHPESAVVPQARRLLDRVRGAVPRS
jgi:tetratricopeptide (TPR) repeat protein